MVVDGREMASSIPSNNFDTMGIKTHVIIASNVVRTFSGILQRPRSLSLPLRSTL